MQVDHYTPKQLIIFRLCQKLSLLDSVFCVELIKILYMQALSVEQNFILPLRTFC